MLSIAWKPRMISIDGEGSAGKRFGSLLRVDSPFWRQRAKMEAAPPLRARPRPRPHYRHIDIGSAHVCRRARDHLCQDDGPPAQQI